MNPVPFDEVILALAREGQRNHRVLHLCDSNRQWHDGRTPCQWAQVRLPVAVDRA